MTIKEGYDGKPTKIRIVAAGHDRIAEVWLEQEGMPRYAEAVLGGAMHDEDNLFERIQGHSETLAYSTLTELLELRDQINAVIQELIA